MERGEGLGGYTLINGEYSSPLLTNNQPNLGEIMARGIPLQLDLRIPTLTISLQIGFHMIIYCYFHNDLIIRLDLSSIIRI